MPVLSQDREEDVPECSGQEISRIFWGKSDSLDIAFGNADLYIIAPTNIYIQVAGRQVGWLAEFLFHVVRFTAVINVKGKFSVFNSFN